MPSEDAHEQIVITTPSGEQLLVTRWVMQDDRIDIDWRATTDHRERWTPIALAGGDYTVSAVE